MLFLLIMKGSGATWKNRPKKIVKNMTFFIDNDNKKDVKIKFDDKKNWMKIEVDNDVETIPYLSSKNEIEKDDDVDTILYTSLNNSPKHEINEKIYVQPKLETIEEIEEKTVKKEHDFIKFVIDEKLTKSL